MSKDAVSAEIKTFQATFGSNGAINANITSASYAALVASAASITTHYNALTLGEQTALASAYNDVVAVKNVAQNAADIAANGIILAAANIISNAGISTPTATHGAITSNSFASIANVTITTSAAVKTVVSGASVASTVITADVFNAATWSASIDDAGAQVGDEYTITWPVTISADLSSTYNVATSSKTYNLIVTFKYVNASSGWTSAVAVTPAP